MKSSIAVAFVVAGSLLGACGGGAAVDGGSEAGSGIDASADGGTNADTGRDVIVRDVIHCEGSANGTEVSGVVLSPNGQDPIFGALVYATTSDIAPIPADVGCDTCDIPPDALDFGVTGADGRFSLREVANQGGTVNLVVQKGRFRRVTPLTLQACTPYVATPAQTSLPGASGPGVDFPKILVATHVNDEIATVLTRIGITEFEQPDGCRTAATSQDISNCLLGQILLNPAAIVRYNIIFLPCGVFGDYQTWQLLPPELVTALQGFLEAGGRLYVSDLSYGIVQRTDPEAFAFPGGTTPTAAGNDPADIGIGGTGGNPVSGVLTSQDLSAWMQNLGALQSDGTVYLEGFRNPWGAIDSAAATSTTWVHAPVRWEGVTGAVDHPLSVEAVYRGGNSRGCGRVLMTSYHTGTAATGALTPQERLLEWLIFDLAGCATPG